MDIKQYFKEHDELRWVIAFLIAVTFVALVKFAPDLLLFSTVVIGVLFAVVIVTGTIKFLIDDIFGF